MPDTKSLPATVETRPLTTDDARAVFELTQAAKLHDTGQSMFEFEDIRGDWARPSYHLGAQSVGYFEDGVLVAYSEVHRNRIESYVHPAHRRAGWARRSSAGAWPRQRSSATNVPDRPCRRRTSRRSLGSTPTPGPAPSAPTSTWAWAWWRRTSTTVTPA